MEFSSPGYEPHPGLDYIQAVVLLAPFFSLLHLTCGRHLRCFFFFLNSAQTIFEAKKNGGRGFLGA